MSTREVRPLPSPRRFGAMRAAAILFHRGPGSIPAQAILRRPSDWAAGSPFRELMRDELCDCWAYRVPPRRPAPRFAGASLPTAAAGFPSCHGPFQVSPALAWT
jgi:hypothetical protein